MKKLLFIVGIFLIIPLVTNAAWWNPFSWGKEQKFEQPVLNIQAMDSIERATSTSVQAIVEKPIEKTVTKTITVQDPKLQAQINSLIAENNELKKKLSQVESTLSACKIDLINKTAVVNSKAIDSQMAEKIKGKISDLTLLRLEIAQISDNGRRAFEPKFDNYKTLEGFNIFGNRGGVPNETNGVITYPDPSPLILGLRSVSLVQWRSSLYNIIDQELKRLNAELDKYQ